MRDDDASVTRSVPLPRAVAHLAQEVILAFAGDPMEEPLPPATALAAVAVALGALSGASAQARGIPLSQVLDSLLIQVREIAESEFARPLWTFH
jgi:hypothetical protein